MGKEEGDGIQNTYENVRTTKFYKLLPFKTGNVLACMFAENNLSKKGKNELLQFIQFQFSYSFLEYLPAEEGVQKLNLKNIPNTLIARGWYNCKLACLRCFLSIG